MYLLCEYRSVSSTAHCKTQRMHKTLQIVLICYDLLQCFSVVCLFDVQLFRCRFMLQYYHQCIHICLT